MEKTRYVHKVIKTPHWDKRLKKGHGSDLEIHGVKQKKSLQANGYSLDLNKKMSQAILCDRECPIYCYYRMFSSIRGPLPT